MKYIRRTNGKREIVEKKKHSRVYWMQVAIRWGFCLSIFALVITGCVVLNQRINSGKLIDKVKNTVAEVPVTESVFTDTEELLETETELEEHILTVCLDPGHGGMDPGCDYNGRKESDDNWNFALKLKEEMEKAGICVILTREDNNTKVFLKERVALANQSDADYFISIHRNKGDGYGNETWMTATTEGTPTQILTSNIHNAIVEVGVQRDRGIKQGTDSGEGSDYYVIGNTKMPACLLEFGFINNEEDNRLFDVNMQQYAAAMTQAVLATYEECKAKEEEQPEEASDDEMTEGADSKGKRLEYPQMDNISALPSEIYDWGHGGGVDEYNRPNGCLSYQEKFKAYPADFIIPNAADKKIYLTLDEGYEYGCTPDILDTLKEKNVSAVFFVTKPFVEQNPEYVKRMIAEGHIVGNHSVTHPAAGIPSLDVESQKKEFMEMHQYIKDNFDYDMFLFRFPAGKFSEQSLAVANNCGYRSVFWSFAYLDYDVENQPDEEESLQKMVNSLHPGAIYLLHAESWTNTHVLGRFIDQAREAGYEFGVYSDTLN